MTKRFSPRVITLLAAALLAVWIFTLRASSFEAGLWNVDEAIHAAVATTLRDGGVLYRDAIDQRTPLSYHAYAAVFALAGGNNLPAVRMVVAGLIVATALLVFLLAWRARSLGTAGIAAVIFSALSTNLLIATDAFAAHTEWFVILFSTAAAWCTWGAIARPTAGRGALAGALYALAFLSKQPALLEPGAALALTGLLVVTRAWNSTTALRFLAGLAGGFLAVTGATALYFAAHGALGDAVFYTWTYNVKFYGPEIAPLERAAQSLMPFAVLWREYPLILLAVLGGGAAAVVQLVQLRPSADEVSRRPWAVFLLAWSALAFAGAASGGRGFEHYAIQCLPPFSLLAATALRAFAESALACWRRERTLGVNRISAAIALLLSAAALGTCLVHPLRTWHLPLPPTDPAEPIADFIRAHSSPDESLFVWGYNPDIHLYAQRKPASRFVYCSFLTGLIPWTNLAPEKDTTYAIVPGSMDTLLGELEAKRPAFIVDCTPGPHRHFRKYPLAKFPVLERFIAEHYAVVDAGRFVPQGFRVHLIRDSFRKHAPVTATTGARRATPIALTKPPPPFGPDNADRRATNFDLTFTAGEAVVTRLEVLVDGTAVEAASFLPSRGVSLTFAVPLGPFAEGRHELATRITAVDGSTATSDPFPISIGSNALPPEQQEQFALTTTRAPLAPISVQAPYGPRANEADARKQFYVHAPSRIVYELDGAARRLSGACGILPGAYAPENKSPTDGAGFRIEFYAADGRRTVLLERVLRPKDNSWERGDQSFAVAIPPHAAGARIEFLTNAGPAGNGACDWTYWNDLLLEADAK